jgi:hypothetical protein
MRYIKLLVGKPEGWNYLKDLGTYGRTILKCILWKLGGTV